ncbi:tRNA 2-selenouridine(34) synthase MnmH [Tropicimonas sp. IMCC34011]|uniref:tRNA 2-selenouridine(34) synthase MnmH n=1 Tax=Tropicimonas sp. IMCC34011 TaxID=2248759 RepID=UPI000E22BC05|nr:tRNA 2-selenouridine(34) synthase MnmH [Tropicimonas sp. IMCC34011]
MAIKLTDFSDLSALPFDTVIDVRAPSEFAEDHVPGAISLPVLNDHERAEVGTIYTQESPFRARKIGAALIAANAARHLSGPLADKEGGWKPLVYCWRGGQRSGSFASILSQIGWRVDIVEGGYRSFRRLVVKALHDEDLPHRIVLLDGDTGTGKTDILARIAERGGQVLDLEGMANHRGSVLGPMPGGQPAQKMFETRIAAALAGFDPEKPVLVEAESSKVGACLVPPSLWKAMLAAPRLTVEAAPDERARYLARAYGDVTADLPHLEALLGQLVRLRGRDTVERWIAMARAGQMEALAADLIARHYDARYAKSRARLPEAEAAIGITLDEDGLGRAADRILAELARL